MERYGEISQAFLEAIGDVAAGVTVPALVRALDGLSVTAAETALSLAAGRIFSGQADEETDLLRVLGQVRADLNVDSEPGR